jgi:hypothetical protein
MPLLALPEAIRKAIREVGPDQPVTNVCTLEDVIAASVAQRRLPHDLRRQLLDQFWTMTIRGAADAVGRPSGFLIIKRRPSGETS